MLKATFSKLCLVSALALAGAVTVHARPVTIGLSADVTSTDPHFHDYSPNLNVADHIFNRLVERNDQLRLVPGLATSWRAVDDTTWEFKLRPNVKFHDGSAFTAEDVVFSINRVANVKDSPGPLTSYTKSITSVEAVDPLTVRIKTATPYPLIPHDLSMIGIVSKKVAENATTADFNSGKAAIGTGPYKLSKFTRGDRVELVRNDAYWGRQPQAERLTLKILTNDAARVASLLSNDVQVMENLPVGDLERLKSSPDVSVVQRAGTRLIYLQPNMAQASKPFVTDASGNPLPKNPFSDVRVRQAVSKAIDRDLIRDRVMQGASRPSGQLVGEGLSGHSDQLKPDAVDVAGAKKLLADAGYPNGFNLTIHGPNNRYVQDEQILQAVAQMLGRVGIATKVEAMPAAVYFPRANKGEFSLYLLGFAPGTGEASSMLKPLIATRNKDKGMGAFNSQEYSNPKVDQLIDKAVSTVADAPRDKLLQEATETAMQDYALVPIHFQMNLWGTRKPVQYSGRANERTYGFDLQLANP